MAKLSFMTYARDRYLPTVLPTLAPTTHDTEPAVRQTIFENARGALRDFLLVAHYTAARRRQVWALEARDVDLEHGTVTFRSPKGSEFDLTVPVHSALRPVLEERLRRRPEGRLFPEYSHPRAATRAWCRLRAKLGLGDFRLHDWRHDAGYDEPVRALGGRRPPGGPRAGPLAGATCPGCRGPRLHGAPASVRRKPREMTLCRV